tara:strand:- start:110 stop:373 length:264 start_codon:yes stop_codon:yes gene_type:complete
MAKKARKNSRPKPLGKRFAKDPVKVTKAEWKKLPLPAKVLVGAAALGALGGATVAADIEAKVPYVGGIIGKAATWGSNLAIKLQNGA